MLLAIPAVPDRVCVFGCRITLIEAAQLLGTFDEPLREYAEEKLNKQGVHLKKVCHGIVLLVVSLLALTLWDNSHLTGSACQSRVPSSIM